MDRFLCLCNGIEKPVCIPLQGYREIYGQILGFIQQNILPFSIHDLGFLGFRTGFRLLKLREFSSKIASIYAKF